MDYLTAWQEGCKDGLALSVDQINKWCGTNFKKLSEVLIYINQLQSEAQHDQG